MINKIIYLFFLIAFQNINAQVNNIEEIFKAQLYLNKTNSYSSETLYLFSSNIFIKIEKLNIDNYLHGSSQADYAYFKLKESNIQYMDSYKVEKTTCSPLGFYILGINLNSGVSYRLAGFESNDFIGFFNDFKEKYGEKKFNRLKVKKFIKNYKVENLDFECLYNGLRNINAIDKVKYPCLQKCEDIFKIN